MNNPDWTTPAEFRKTMLEEEYYTDYPTEPIGGGNPYYRCSHCKMSVPEINGYLERHAEWCEYRINKMEKKTDEKILELAKSSGLDSFTGENDGGENSEYWEGWEDQLLKFGKAIYMEGFTVGFDVGATYSLDVAG